MRVDVPSTSTIAARGCFRAPSSAALSCDAILSGTEIPTSAFNSTASSVMSALPMPSDGVSACPALGRGSGLSAYAAMLAVGQSESTSAKESVAKASFLIGDPLHCPVTRKGQREQDGFHSTMRPLHRRPCGVWLARPCLDAICAARLRADMIFGISIHVKRMYNAIKNER